MIHRFDSTPSPPCHPIPSLPHTLQASIKTKGFFVFKKQFLNTELICEHAREPQTGFSKDATMESTSEYMWLASCYLVMKVRCSIGNLRGRSLLKPATWSYSGHF